MPHTRNKSILSCWDISIETLTKVIHANPSLRGMILGYIAEMKLHDFFKNHPKITRLHKDDDHDRNKKGDLTLTYKGCEIRIEVKSLQTHTIRQHGANGFSGKVQCDASDRRTVHLSGDKTLETTCLQIGEFDILAVCLFSFRNKWEYGFAHNNDLPRSSYAKYPPEIRNQLLKSLIPVTWPLQAPFASEPFFLLDQVVREKQRSK